jgi:hypothetical protein
MTPIKQINNHSCALACIESLSIDKNKHISQQQLIDLYPTLCNKGNNIEGAIDIPSNLCHILIDLGLSTVPPFVGEGLPFLLSHVEHLQDGVFLYTKFAHDGKTLEHHCWRLVQMTEGYFVVIEPLAQCPYPYMHFPLSYLETRGCRAVVCNTKSTNQQ